MQKNVEPLPLRPVFSSLYIGTFHSKAKKLGPLWSLLLVLQLTSALVRGPCSAHLGSFLSTVRPYCSPLPLPQQARQAV